MLVHGVLVSSRYLLPAAVELADEFPVLVPDLPGYGLSTAPRSAPELSSLADAVIAADRRSRRAHAHPPGSRWQRCAVDEHLSVLPIMSRDVADIGLRRARQLLRVMLDDQIEAKLERVRCPALVLRGGRDRVAPAAWSARVAQLLPAGRLVVVPGYAHMAHYSGALAVVPHLRAFLREPLTCSATRADATPLA